MSIGPFRARTPNVPTPRAAVATVQAASPNVDERWKAWHAKGAAHDRAVRRKLAIAAPIIAVVGIAISCQPSIEISGE